LFVFLEPSTKLNQILNLIVSTKKNKEGNTPRIKSSCKFAKASFTIWKRLFIHLSSPTKLCNFKTFDLFLVMKSLCFMFCRYSGKIIWIADIDTCVFERPDTFEVEIRPISYKRSPVEELYRESEFSSKQKCSKVPSSWRYFLIKVSFCW